MKKTFYAALLAFMVLLIACGGDGKSQSKKDKLQAVNQLLDDDESIYGLASEGGTDSVIYLLPFDGSDPVQYDIIAAHRNNKILGTIKTGDWIAIVPNKTKKNVADMVIDLEQLKGTWAYKVTPELRDNQGLSKSEQQKIIDSMPDSIKNTYVVPREYGFTLKRHFSAHEIGWTRPNTALDEESPVVYPEIPLYREWHILNGKLVLSRATKAIIDINDDEDNELPLEKLINDTIDIISLKNDSLVLKFKNHEQSYYRVKNQQLSSAAAKRKLDKK